VNVKALRTVGIAVGLLVVDVVICAKLIPAAGGGRGAPTPILFLGLIYGLVNGVTAAGIVLIYRSIRIINFAQIAVGAAGFVLIYDFVSLTHIPFVIAFVFGIVVAALVGMLFEVVFVRRFFEAPRVVLTVFTIVAASFLGSTARNAVDILPIFPDRSERSVAQLAGTQDISGRLPFHHFHFTLPGSATQFGFPHVFAIAIALLALGAVAAFIRYTKLGVAIRALAENSERAALLGISVGTLSVVIWGIAGALSGIGATMTGLLGSPTASLGFAPELLLPALAAAVVARMSSISVALVVAVGIGVFEQSLNFLQPAQAPLYFGVLLLVIVIGLLVQRTRGGRSELGGSGSWEATQEIRPVPSEMSSLFSVRVVRWIGVLLVGALAIGFPFFASKPLAYTGAVVALDAIVGLSVIVLTGWAGQVSLGQFALAAVGAVVNASLMVRAGLPFWVAIPIAVVITAALAVLLGLPALRLPGLYLAAATFAFAIAVPNVLFNKSLFGWLVPTSAVSRPTIPFVNFDDERSMYFLAVVALGVSVYAVRNLRRSRYGRILIGIRDNEANAASAGLSPLRMKLIAFGVAGGLAGFAGALLSIQQRGVAANAFPASASIDAFVVAVLGGMGSIFGPIVGASVIRALQIALGSFPEIAGGVAPLIALVLLYIEPGGLISILARVRDSSLRIIAQRNQLVVPSLFADIDPRALHLRLIPIAAPDASTDALGRISRRYDERNSSYADTRAEHLIALDQIALASASTNVDADA
jgi:branched-chain amino acid transport system permease protein